MHHAFIDQFSYLDSPVHRLDPRTKIVVFLSFVVLMVLTPIQQVPKFGLYLGWLAAVIALSRVPVPYILKHALLIVPFALMVAVFLPFLHRGAPIWSWDRGPLRLQVTREGLWVLLNVLVKSFLSVLTMVTLASTTKFSELLKGFERLRMPRIMVLILSFLYRYIFVLIDQVYRMKRARDSRNVGHKGPLWNAKIVGHMIGVLFIRTYEKAERIYAAMASRGFDGEVRTLSVLKIRSADVLFALLFYGYVTLIWGIGPFLA